MFISRLEVRQLRNLTSVSLHPCRGINIIEGANASGKTSLLEAIHLLCLARSFRTLRTSHIVQHGASRLTLFAEICSGQIHHRLGLQRDTDNRLELRLDGRQLASRSELVSLAPLQLLTPESSSIITGSPRGRRHFMDWLMFHVEPGFHPLWLNYQRLMKQRNSLLRSGKQLETLPQWDRSLIHHGQQLDVLRKDMLEQFIPIIKEYSALLLPDLQLQIKYRQGWRAGVSLEAALHDSMQSDRKQGMTTVGPHRCDLVFESESRPVLELLSRGQLKLLVVALVLAQMKYLSQGTGKQSIMLVDDLPAELDAAHRQLLIDLLSSGCEQVFITTTERRLLGVDIQGEENKMFHVEHGQVKEVV